MQIDKNPSGRQLAVFGACWFLCFGFWGARAAIVEGVSVPAVLLLAVAVLVPAAGCLWRKVLLKAYILASAVTRPVGAAVSFLILAAAYYGVVTPVGLILRLAGHDPMKRRFESSVTSYWEPREPERDPARYFHQY